MDGSGKDRADAVLRIVGRRALIAAVVAPLLMLAAFDAGKAAAQGLPSAHPGPGRFVLAATQAGGLRDAAVENRVLILGDSLSAEYGLKRGSGWVALLEARLAQQRADFVGKRGEPAVVNASISGETTAGGRSRLPALLERHRPAIVVIALGANDALRGLDLATTQENLGRMIDEAKAAGARPVLVGMMVPPNYGRAYADRFAGIYPALARDRDVALVPFLLEGFAEDTSRFQADRIHPNETAQQRMLDNVWPTLERLVSR
jgi:acyl-CoA thioesterase-1